MKFLRLNKNACVVGLKLGTNYFVWVEQLVLISKLNDLD